jgi:uncharacterized protein
MNVQERAIHIPGPTADMLGIVSMSMPGAPRKRIAVVVVVGGAQYRVGSHRQFVQLARRLAAAGHPVLRFDLPGMGDSPDEPIPFEETSAHIGVAIDAVFNNCPGVDGVVLWGLCDGASASLLYANITQDKRLFGLALLNPWVRSEASMARAHVKQYYRLRLMEPAFWKKLIGGRVGWPALQALGKNLRAMRRGNHAPLNFQDAMANGWQNFKGPILLMLSERDLTAKAFQEHALADTHWAGALERPQLSLHSIKGADHTCSSATASRQMESLVMQWLSRLGPAQ